MEELAEFMIRTTQMIFYGYRYFFKKHKNVQIIEMQKAKKNKLRNFIGFIDNLLRKISNCSFS